MKKVFNSLFVIIAAMVTFAGCAKQETDAPATSETKTVQFFANSIETKTVFGTPDGTTYPTLWTAGDKVKVHVNLSAPSGVTKTETSVDVKLVGGEDMASSATFTAELNDAFEAESYTLYSVSPSSAWNARSANEGRFTVNIKYEQTPLPTSVDSDVQVLYAISGPYTDGIPTSVNLDYKHFTAYGKLSLKGLADGVVISKIKLESADLDLAGKWNYYVADKTVAAKEGVKYITLETSSTTDIWFACAPVDVSNKTLTLTVTTNQGDFVKELSFPANRKFEAGKISKFTVDMTGITAGGSEEPEQPGEITAYYEKVTSAPTDWSGKYLLVNETAAKALSAISTTSTKYGLGTDVTISNEKIIATDALSACQVEISKATVNSDAYVMMFGGKYLTWTSGNSLNVATSESANTNWIITLSDGNAVIKNSNDNTRQIFWNPQSPRFACYNKDGQSAVQLYVLVDSNEGGGETPEPEPQEPYIRVSQEEFNVPATQTSVTFTVEANVGWGVEHTEGVTDVKIIEVSEDELVMTVEATFGENESDEPQTHTITFIPKELDETVTVTINQDAKVEVDDSFEAGDYWIVANGKYAMPVTSNYDYLKVDDAGYKDNVFTFKKVENGYTIQQSDDKYLYMKGTYNNFNVSATAPTEGHIWTIAKNEDGSYKILNVLMSKYIQLDSQYGTYGSYDAVKGTMPKLVPADDATERPVFSVTSASKNVACDVTEASFEIVSNQNWTVVPGEGVSVNVTSGSGNRTVTMTFAENTSEEAVVYTATVKAEGFDDIVLTVTQSGVPQEGGDEGGSEGPLTIVLSAATKPCDTFPETSAGVTTTSTYTIDGYEWTFSPSSGNKFSWYPSDKYILWGKTGGYILLPAVEGKKLTSVTILTGKGASTSVKVGVFTADGTSAVSGGEAKTLNAQNTEFTWTLTGTEVNTHYQLRVTSKHNAQLQTLTLIYE